MSDKLYRILVVSLLAALVVLQIIGIARTIKSSECSKALASANSLQAFLKTQMNSVFDNYKKDAYGTASNINQQIFAANEYQFIIENIIAQQNSATLDIVMACK